MASKLPSWKMTNGGTFIFLLNFLRKFQQGKPVAEQEISNKLLYETQTYAESHFCRRKMLLHYFGEEYNQENCGNCDNCRKTYRMMDATELLTLILETIHQLNEKFRSRHVVDIIKGNMIRDECCGVVEEHIDKLLVIGGIFEGSFECFD